MDLSGLIGKQWDRGQIIVRKFTQLVLLNEHSHLIFTFRLKDGRPYGGSDGSQFGGPDRKRPKNGSVSIIIFYIEFCSQPCTFPRFCQ